MTTNAKRLLDYLPFAGLLVYSIYQWITYYQPDQFINGPTIYGLLLLFVIAVAFVKKHHLAVLLTGLTCLAGSFGFVSLSPSISTGNVNTGEAVLSFYPAFLVLLLLHLLFSWRWYTGIFTEKYWQDFKTGSHGR